jgi:hypothetical protein
MIAKTTRPADEIQARHGAPAIDPSSVDGTTALALTEEVDLRAGAALARIAAYCRDDVARGRTLLRVALHGKVLVHAQAEETATMRLARYLESLGLLSATVRDATLILYDADGTLVPLPDPPPFDRAARFLEALRVGNPYSAIDAALALTPQDVHYPDLWIDRDAVAALRFPR